MAGQGYESDAAAMTQAVNAFAQCAADAKQAMTNLESTLRDTLGKYQGDQAVAFWNLHTEIQGQMTTANHEIDTMSTLVNQSYSNYNTGDANAASSLKTVASNASGLSSTLSRLNGV